MNFGEHSALAGAITILIYFIYPDWIQMSIIMLFIGAIIPDVMEPTKQNSFFEITSLFYNSFPNVSRGKEGYKHRGFFC